MMSDADFYIRILGNAACCDVSAAFE